MCFVQDIILFGAVETCLGIRRWCANSVSENISAVAEYNLIINGTMDVHALSDYSLSRLRNCKYIFILYSVRQNRPCVLS